MLFDEPAGVESRNVEPEPVTIPPEAPVNPLSDPRPASSPAPSPPPSPPPTVQKSAIPSEPVTANAPVQLLIPNIDVDAPIERVGITPDGAMGIPKNPANAGWYALGARPGDIGSAVIAGHLNWYQGVTGAFANLHKLKPGDTVMTQDNNGEIVFFAVREIRTYDAADEAVDVFSSSDGKAHLNLITCEGAWDKVTKQYTERLVVFTERVGE